MRFDREKKQAYALEVKARDGAASARPNSNGEPNSGKSKVENFWSEKMFLLYFWNSLNID